MLSKHLPYLLFRQFFLLQLTRWHTWWEAIPQNLKFSLTPHHPKMLPQVWWLVGATLCTHCSQMMTNMNTSSGNGALRSRRIGRIEHYLSNCQLIIFAWWLQRVVNPSRSDWVSAKRSCLKFLHVGYLVPLSTHTTHLTL